MGDSNIRYADIIIDISHEALDKVFQYRVPLSLWEEVQPGSRVFVPFGRGNRETEGYVIAIRQEADYEESKIKEILRVNTEGISVESELIQVASFFKEKYGSTMIQALRTKIRRSNYFVNGNVSILQPEQDFYQHCSKKKECEKKKR